MKRIRPVATMTLVMPNGKEYYHEDELGYDSGYNDARYMYEEGNYSCDCNRSLFIHRKHPEVEIMDCGNKIQLKDFDVVFRKRI